MDIASARQQLQTELNCIQDYLGHPFTVAVLEDLQSQQQIVIQEILNKPVTNIETFFAREQALGHLRGLGRAFVHIQEKADDIKAQLNALPNE